MTDLFELELGLLLEAIHARYHYDFRGYARASLRRRLEAALPKLDCATLSQLQDRVLREPAVFTALLGELTVTVSELFRDPPYWRALRREVVPLLRTYPSVRIWIAGCATGEEVYSFAVLLAEEGLLSRATLYATDIDAEALHRAEAGVYDRKRLDAFEEAYRAAGLEGRLADHLTEAYDRVVFRRELRERAVFADHSLATDGVFAEVQLVSCRNVLIYFDRALQARALGVLAGSLGPRGFLGLGAREALRSSPVEGDFEEIDREARLWRRRGAP